MRRDDTDEEKKTIRQRRARPTNASSCLAEASETGEQRYGNFLHDNRQKCGATVQTRSQVRILPHFWLQENDGKHEIPTKSAKV